MKIDSAIEETFEGFDKANNLPLGSTEMAILNRPEVKEGMLKYLNAHGVKADSWLDARELAAMVYFQHQALRAKFKKTQKANFVGSEQDFDSFEGTDVYSFTEENFIANENEAVGFDSFSGDENFEGFALGAIAKIGKKVGQKIVGAVKKGIEKRKAQKNATNAIAEVERTNVVAPQNVPMVQSLQATSGGNEVINKIKDAFQMGINDYKEAEKAKEINKLMPYFILSAIALLTFGFFVGKKS